MSSLMDLSNYSGAGGCILAQSYKELWPDLPWFEELGGEGGNPKSGTLQPQPLYTVC